MDYTIAQSFSPFLALVALVGCDKFMLYFTKQVCCPSWIWATNLSPISCRKRTKRLGYYVGTNLNYLSVPESYKHIAGQ
jgi:hypothetical protein